MKAPKLNGDMVTKYPKPIFPAFSIVHNHIIGFALKNVEFSEQKILNELSVCNCGGSLFARQAPSGGG